MHDYVIEGGLIRGHEIAAQTTTPELCAYGEQRLWCKGSRVRIVGETPFFFTPPFPRR